MRSILNLPLLGEKRIFPFLEEKGNQTIILEVLRTSFGLKEVIFAVSRPNPQFEDFECLKKISQIF